MDRSKEVQHRRNRDRPKSLSNGRIISLPYPLIQLFPKLLFFALDPRSISENSLIEDKTCFGESRNPWDAIEYSNECIGIDTTLKIINSKSLNELLVIYELCSSTIEEFDEWVETFLTYLLRRDSSFSLEKDNDEHMSSSVITKKRQRKRLSVTETSDESSEEDVAQNAEHSNTYISAKSKIEGASRWTMEPHENETCSPSSNKPRIFKLSSISELPSDNQLPVKGRNSEKGKQIQAQPVRSNIVLQYQCWVRSKELLKKYHIQGLDELKSIENKCNSEID